MKLLLAYICIIIFSFQVLPVKEIGKLLSKAQNTEEVHTDDGLADNPLKLKKDGDPFLNYQFLQFEAGKQYHTKKARIALLQVAYMPDAHIPDIPTPPPNC